jgi:hypothetical protein
MKNILTIWVLLICFSSTAQDKVAGVYPFVLDKKNWGIIDANKKVILEPQYQRIQFFNFHMQKNAFAIVTSHEFKFGVVDRNGKEIITPTYDLIFSLENKQNENVRAKKNGKMGIMNILTQEVILPFEYDEIKWFKGTEVAVAVIKKNGKFGAVTSEGKIIASPIYEYVFYEKEGANPEMLLVDKNNMGKVINANGKVINRSVSMGNLDVDIDDNQQQDYSSSRKYFIKKEKYGEEEVTIILLKHPKLKETVEEIYKGTEEIIYVDVYIDEENQKPAYNYIIAQKNGKYGILGKDKSVITPFEFDEFDIGKDKEIILKKGSLKGVANEKGKLIYDAIFGSIQFYNDLDSLHNYFFISTSNGAFGYADMTGNIFLPD